MHIVSTPLPHVVKHFSYESCCGTPLSYVVGHPFIMWWNTLPSCGGTPFIHVVKHFHHVVEHTAPPPLSSPLLPSPPPRCASYLALFLLPLIILHIFILHLLHLHTSTHKHSRRSLDVQTCINTLTNKQ